VDPIPLAGGYHGIATTNHLACRNAWDEGPSHHFSLVLRFCHPLRLLYFAVLLLVVKTQDDIPSRRLRNGSAETPLSFSDSPLVRARIIFPFALKA